VIFDLIVNLLDFAIVMIIIGVMASLFQPQVREIYRLLCSIACSRGIDREIHLKVGNPIDLFDFLNFPLILSKIFVSIIELIEGNFPSNFFLLTRYFQLSFLIERLASSQIGFYCWNIFKIDSFMFMQVRRRECF
jgi:hypothetical protein